MIQLKRTLLSTIAAFILAQAASAQITLTATPSTQTVDLSSSNLFNVTISISGAPADMVGFDLWLETIAANSGYFSIAGASPSSGSPFDFPTGPGNYPDEINTSNSSHSGFAQNSGSQGFGSSSPQTYNGDLVTLTLAVNPGTPTGTTYNFNTTEQATSGNNRGSSVSTTTTTHYVDNPATFSVTVIPEPSTWALIGVGALGFVALNRFRGRRN